MKKHKQSKRILSFIMTLALILPMAVNLASVNAAGTPVNALYTNNGTGGYKIVECDANGSNATSNPVVNTDVTNLFIDSGVTEITFNAFYNCTTMASVNFTNATSLTTIGNDAFYGCTGLTSVVIPEKVETIGECAFMGCSKLASVDFSNATNLTTIGNNAFDGCPKLTNVDLSKATKLTTLSNFVFSNCSELKNVTIPTSIETIGSAAFYSCSKLASINLSDATNLKTIDISAFHFCSELKKVTIPASVTSIGEKAFRNCSTLADITFGATTPPTIGTEAFSYTASVLTVHLPAGSDKNAWSTALKGANPVVDIAGAPVYGLYKADGTTVECDAKGVETAGGNTVANNTVTNLFIASDVTAIGDNAFRRCPALTSVVIPANVTSIGERAFVGCMNLKTVDLTKATSLKTIGIGAFIAIAKGATIYVPDGSKASVWKMTFDDAFNDNIDLKFVDKIVSNPSTSPSPSPYVEEPPVITPVPTASENIPAKITVEKPTKSPVTGDKQNVFFVLGGLILAGGLFVISRKKIAD